MNSFAHSPRLVLNRVNEGGFWIYAKCHLSRWGPARRGRSNMSWLRRRDDPRPVPSTAQEASLARLAESGTEVVLFISACSQGCICEAARMLDGGRIPIKLAEMTPLADCTNREDCTCHYEAWP